MGNGRGGCMRLGGREGLFSLESLLKELKECCGELEPLEEEFNIFFFFFVEVKVLKKDQKDTKRMKIEEETFPN